MAKQDYSILKNISLIFLTIKNIEFISVEDLYKKAHEIRAEIKNQYKYSFVCEAIAEELGYRSLNHAIYSAVTPRYSSIKYLINYNNKHFVDKLKQKDEEFSVFLESLGFKKIDMSIGCKTQELVVQPMIKYIPALPILPTIRF